MAQATRHDDEAGRLAALRRLHVLDSDPEEAFENVVSLVRQVLGVPIATVALVDENRQWFKARRGLDIAETARDVSFCTHTIQTDDPLIVPDAEHDARFAANPFVLGQPGIRAYLGIPLRCSDGYNLGALCAIDTAPREFTSAEIALLTSFSQIVVSELELRRVAQFDTMTGALSRRAFVDRMEEEIERFQRYKCDSSLLLFDIDHFKSVNDRFGHPGGDTALSEVVATIKRIKRPNDIIGRLGGEEFAMLLPETDAGSALQAAERYREAIAAQSIAITPGTHLTVSASFGIAGLHSAIRTPAQWLACADVPLYQAKRSGRNCSRTVAAPTGFTE
ncbi:sensor domain-containing diguanylate cyclase [Novosphingobium sp. 1949]|uniref:diguanylate cyclase n=1 Tax=Novosphingobium organovorum TaxID=2930092 RepID=A0ABT0B7X6_9SPHN|nr:sensor domain-containing diguanylate cyclase [Novosphingobium organovorum]MCJ2181108.1 sensor domain-containing diguanylate cyclase [Novosphingobium organovorum]